MDKDNKCASGTPLVRLTEHRDAGLHPASSPLACSCCHEMILERRYQLQLEPRSALFLQRRDQQTPLGLSLSQCAKTHPN